MTLARHGEPIPVHPPEERVGREEMRTAVQQPRILLTDDKVLEPLLTRANDIEQFGGVDLEFLVTDRAHTFLGSLGSLYTDRQGRNWFRESRVRGVSHP